MLYICPCRTWSNKLGSELERVLSSQGTSSSSSSSTAVADSTTSSSSRSRSNNNNSSSSSESGSEADEQQLQLEKLLKDPMAASRWQLGSLTSMFDPQRLKEHTQLMDRNGVHLREGATILMTATEGGNILVQGEH